MNDSIYLDYAATCPLDPRVLKAMQPWLAQDMAGNPHARHHRQGAAADLAVHSARAQIAARINAAAHEIVFTSGATEANNLVIKGLAQHLRARGKMHVITSAVEHASVLETLRAMEAEGFLVSILPVKPCGGLIEADMIERALTDQTGLVCVQAVNNETGVIQPLNEITQMLRGKDILLHCDAAQALGKVDFNVEKTGVDFASFSAHKVYGPQGIGAVYIKVKNRARLSALHHGGGQEEGLRAGTLPAALCVGFGVACALIEDDRTRLQSLREIFLTRLRPLAPVVHGHRLADWNVPGILNIGFPGIDSETLVMLLPGLAFGLGAACSAGGHKHSHVIKALTGSEQAAQEAIRLSFGRFTTADDIHGAADQIIFAWTDIKKMEAA